MSFPSTLLLITLLATPRLGTAPAVDSTDSVESAAPVALVILISGRALVQPANSGAETWEPLDLYQRLFPGMRIRTGVSSEVTIVMFDGQRMVLEAASRGTVGKRDLDVESGAWRRLEPVPAMVEIPPLVQPGKRAGADRIRHQDGRTDPFELYPRDAAVLLDHAVLRFSEVLGVAHYRIEILDHDGHELFAVDSESTQVLVPSHLLETGTVYYWRVGTTEHGHLGGAFFTTLTEPHAKARRRLARQASQGDDLGLRLLLAEVDRALGLWWEACDGLNQLTPGALDDAFHQELVISADCQRLVRDR